MVVLFPELYAEAGLRTGHEELLARPPANDCGWLCLFDDRSETSERELAAKTS